MAIRILKPLEERDPYAALVMDAWDRHEAGLPPMSEEQSPSPPAGNEKGEDDAED